jgi:hypothetical protein
MRCSLVLPPRSHWPSLRRSAWLACHGALIAGGFGILHDQVTYSIAPEYFTKLKFDQFQAMDFGWPRRAFVAEIGFLATWWVGLIGAWFLARLALPKFAAPERRMVQALGVVAAATLLGGTVGGALGPWLGRDRADWQEALTSLGVTDFQAFNRVAGIHLGSYAGALGGWLAMMVRLWMGEGDRVPPPQV